MMNYKSVTIRGFKSFTKEQTFRFPDAVGLYGVVGNNLQDAKLEGNGVGKSTLGDAIVWCYFGKTPRGAKAGSIKNWYSKEKPKVSVSHVDGDKEVMVTRTWSPNTLTYDVNGDSTPISQEDLEDKLGFSYSEFLSTSIIAQGTQMFFDYAPAAKLKMFSDTLELDQWDGYVKRAVRQASSIHSEIIENNALIERVEGKLETLKAMNFSESAQSWEEEEDQVIVSIKANITEKRKKLQSLEEKEARIRKKEKKVKKIDVVSYEDSIKDLLSDRREIDRSLASITSDIRRDTRDIQKVENLGATCPECQQPIGDSHKHSVKEALLESLHAFEKQKIEKQREDAAISEKLQNLKDKQKKSDLLAEEARDKLRDIQYSLREAANDIRSTSSSITEEEYKVNHRQANPWLEKERDRLQKVEVQENRKASLLEEKTKLQVSYEEVTYWKKGFRDIQLFLIQEALSQFEMETNQALQTLGLSNWKVEYVLEKETAGGGITRGFNVLIHSPWNDKPVVWESWSGGESQRLKIAGMLGLINLISNRKGISSDIEIWDEPASYMSEAGVRDMLDTLRDRAYSLSKKIFVMDHVSCEYGGYEDTILFTKDENGTTITCN